VSKHYVKLPPSTDHSLSQNRKHKSKEMGEERNVMIWCVLSFLYCRQDFVLPCCQDGALAIASVKAKDWNLGSCLSLKQVANAYTKHRITCLIWKYVFEHGQMLSFLVSGERICISKPQFSFQSFLGTSSTAQGGGGSFKNRKPIGEVSCCESRKAERIHWWTEKWLELCLWSGYNGCSGHLVGHITHNCWT